MENVNLVKGNDDVKAVPEFRQVEQKHVTCTKNFETLEECFDFVLQIPTKVHNVRVDVHPVMKFILSVVYSID